MSEKRETEVVGTIVASSLATSQELQVDVLDTLRVLDRAAQLQRVLVGLAVLDQLDHLVQQPAHRVLDVKQLEVRLIHPEGRSARGLVVLTRTRYYVHIHITVCLVREVLGGQASGDDRF